MARIIAILLCGLWAFQTAAQTEKANQEPQDKGRIETWLQDTLSTAGREVQITGFSGAFSSEAGFEELSIADDDGVWLRIENATLNWSRSALLSGRVDINEITAETVSILRRPLPGPTISTEDSQSTTFEVPELPVSLEIDQLEVKSIQIGATVLGQDVDLSLSGRAQLVRGQMDVDVEALRTNDEGRFAISATFSNEDRQLGIDLALYEPKGGIAATLLAIPGTPELNLSLIGAAPLTDFAADIIVKTNQSEQVAGKIHYREAAPDSDSPLVFGANLAGDLRPLFAPDFHQFFGSSSKVDLAASRFSDGTLNVETLNLETGALTLQGELELGADRLPNSFNLQGAITADQPVRLPSSGAPITVGGLQLVAAFDASESDSWSADILVADLDHLAAKAPSIRLAGKGTIDRSFGKKITSAVTFRASGLAFTEEKFASAFDGTQFGHVVVNWSEGADLVFETVQLTTETAEIQASGTLGTFTDGLPLSGTATADVADLSRFSALAGRPLGGAANVRIAGRFDVLGGGFDAAIEGQTLDLTTDEPRADPLFSGQTDLSISAARTPEGTFLRGLSLVSPVARIEASGNIDPIQGALELFAELDDLSLVEPKLIGEGTLKSQLVWQEQSGFQLTDLDAKVAGSQVSGNVTYLPDTKKISGDIHLFSPDLSAFAELAAMDLSGAIDLNTKGSADLLSKAYQVDADFSGENVEIGIAQADALIAGTIDGSFSGRLGDEILSIGGLEFNSRLLSITAASNGAAEVLSYSASLRDVAPIAPGFSGPLSLTGTARLDDPNLQLAQIDATATGPAGMTMRATGTVAQQGETVDLALTGAAPLGLVNSFIAPNSIQGMLRYDLNVQGPPDLSSVSGQVSMSDGRVALPDSGIVLGQLDGGVTLSNNAAQIDISGVSTAGGTVVVSGPVSLTSGNSADLNIALRNFGVTEPDLFETSLSGQVQVNGPLTQAARISGDLALGTTEIRVPSSNSGAGGSIPDIKQVGAPQSVTATLNRAGLGTASKSSGSNAMPLNLKISAPNQIFVRGRGLDAELGGSLVLGGTTADVAPSGSFDLIRGRFDILGRRFVMDEGLINLRGSLDPFLRFVAETETSAGNIRLVLEGLASEPELMFESDAGLPEEEAIAHILFDRGLENISAVQAASLVSAVATLSGRSSGGIAGRLRSALGLSDFDVTTTETGQQELRAGAYINENIYSEVTIDSDGNQSIDLNLDITPNIRAKGGTSSDGNTGIGIFFEKDY